MKLSRTEEELMLHLWKLQKAYMKDLIEQYEEPRPAMTTIATLLKRMKDKRFIDYKTLGNAREYFPLVSKKDYFKKHITSLIENFFGNSAVSFASFFTSNTGLTTEELKALRTEIDQEIKKKNKQP